MDDHICIRFHYGGSFTSVGGAQFYVGGDNAASWIDRDKLSYFEILGHLADHHKSSDVKRLFWLVPGNHVSNGLVLLHDDVSCERMASAHTGSQCVDMYVEDVGMELNADDQDIWVGDEGGDEGGDEDNYEDFLEDISDDVVDKSPARDDDKGKGPAETEDGAEGVHLEDSDDSSDEDYKQPADEDSSAEDEEAIELKNYARQIKRNIRAQKLGMHGNPIGDIRAEDLVDEVPNLDEPGSPYHDSSDDYSYGENSDGEIERFKSLENRFDSKAEVPVFSLGMAFIDSRQFKAALVKYGLKAHKSLHFDKDEESKVRAFCDWPSCNWSIYGSKTTRSKWFKVVTFSDVHTCPPRRDNNLVTSTVIANHYYHQMKDNPTWSAALIKAAVLKDFLADVSISKCKRAKSLVQKKALDAMTGEYSRVYDYQLELERSNPGTTVAVCLDPEIEDKKVFGRLYVCFDALKKGFLAGCRKVIGLDGCWLKGAHNGNLLCAIGRDANNQMYPVAWAAVPIENYDSWYWFLSLLQKDLNISNGGQEWVLISDQQKGLLKAAKELVPNAEHRMCARHIYGNWRKKYTDKKLQKKWWRCAKASNRTLFNMYRAYLAQDTPDGARDMMNTSPEHWSRAFFRVGTNCDSVDNNMCESFNHSIMEARFYPVISMCEAIRKKLMVRIQENRTRSEKWTGNICPNIFKKLKMNIELSGKCNVLWNGADGFEVVDWEDRKFIVKLMTRECTCNYWQLSGLPCCHAISSIYKSSQTLEDYIAECYSKSAYMRTYQHVLMPVEGAANWPIADMPRPLPPPYVKMPGRPKTERRREQWEQPKGTKLSRVGVKMSCSLCEKNDHNSRRCPKNPQAGNKNMAHITREKNRKRKEAEAAGAGSSKQQKPTKKGKSTATTPTPTPSQPIGTQGSQAPRPRGTPRATTSARASASATASASARTRAAARASASARAGARSGGNARSSQSVRASSIQVGSARSTAPASAAARARKNAVARAGRGGLANLMFGGNY